MFIHIAKVVEHASNWLKHEGHTAESEIGQAVQKVINFIGHASELEHAAEVLQKAGFKVLTPQQVDPSHPTATPNMSVEGIQKIELPAVDEPAPGTVVVDKLPAEYGTTAK